MYVCMHALMYDYMYVCMHACMYACMCVHMYVCTYVYMFVYNYSWFTKFGKPDSDLKYCNMQSIYNEIVHTNIVSSRHIN